MILIIIKNMHLFDFLSKVRCENIKLLRFIFSLRPEKNILKL